MVLMRGAFLQCYRGLSWSVGSARKSNGVKYPGETAETPG